MPTGHARAALSFLTRPPYGASCRRVPVLTRVCRCAPSRSLSVVADHPTSVPGLGELSLLSSPLSFPPTALSRSPPSEPDGNVPTPSPDPEGHSDAEVSDHEWELRVARAMLHLRENMPRMFETHTKGSNGHSGFLPASELFPPHIFSQNLVLKLPISLPFKITSLQGYSMAFTTARTGMQVFHTHLDASLERMTFNQPPPPSTPEETRLSLLGKTPTHRSRQIRLVVAVHGTPRLPPHTESVWKTSNLYTFSPDSGLIAMHEVESIRPLPGEGVTDWLLAWSGRGGNQGGAVACPRTEGMGRAADEGIVNTRVSERQEKS